MLDAIVIGGSFAGLSAAMQIARARRKVLIIDTGSPRNRFSAASHGFFGQDGEAPSDMIEAARAKVTAYPNAQFVLGEAIGAQSDGKDGFKVEVRDDKTYAASKLVIATGVVDELPAISGLADRWGKTVVHCPYCHGVEFGGLPLGVLSVGPMSVHQAFLIPEWGPTTFFSMAARSMRPLMPG